MFSFPDMRRTWWSASIARPDYWQTWMRPSPSWMVPPGSQPMPLRVLVVIPARIPVIWRHSVIGSRHVMWFSIVWVGLSRSIRIAIVGGPRSPRSTSVIRASSPAAIKRCGRDCSSRAECCGARNPRTYNTSAVTVRSPPILPPRNACDTYWRQGAADPCLGTLNR